MDNWYNMTPSPRVPARQRAFQYLVDTIQHRRQSGSYYLPSIRELSEAAGVSRMTLYKALSALVRQGVVEPVPRRGLMIAGATPAAPLSVRYEEPSHHTGRLPYRRTQVVDAITRDIFAGLWKPGTPLPAKRQLRQRYGVCHPVIARALVDLESRGVVESFTGGYRVRQAVPRQSSATILCVAPDSDSSVFPRLTPRAADFWRCFPRLAFVFPQTSGWPASTTRSRRSAMA